MKWIGTGSLLVKGKLLKYGDDIPRNFPKKQLEKLKGQGKVGAVIEKVDPDPTAEPVQKTKDK